MTDVATPVPTTHALDVAGTPATPFGRLAKVEWRKMTDTRSGFWLLTVTGLLLLLVMTVVTLVVALSDDVEITAGDMVGIFTIPVSLLLPVFAILIVTSEWSQRTALTTFSLEPHRMRVILAKLAAVTQLAIATIVVAIVAGGLTLALCRAISDNDVSWSLDVSELAWTIVVQLLFFWMAFAFGMVLLSTPGSITIFYIVGMLLPLMVWSTLYALFGWAQDVLPWIDFTVASTPVVGGTDIVGDDIEVGLAQYAQFVWTGILWIGIPTLVGFRRIRHAEVK